MVKVGQAAAVPDGIDNRNDLRLLHDLARSYHVQKPVIEVAYFGLNVIATTLVKNHNRGIRVHLGSIMRTCDQAQRVLRSLEESSALVSNVYKRRSELHAAAVKLEVEEVSAAHVFGLSDPCGEIGQVTSGFGSVSEERVRIRDFLLNEYARHIKLFEGLLEGLKPLLI